MHRGATHGGDLFQGGSQWKTTSFSVPSFARTNADSEYRPDELGKPNRAVLLTTSVPQVKKKRNPEGNGETVTP
jgi:hypothetical protein